MQLVPRDTEGRPIQSPEASIMDVADDITYALHDLDDFFRAGVIRKAIVRQMLLEFLAVKDGEPMPGNLLSEKAGSLRRAYPHRFDSELYRNAATEVKRDLTALPEEFAGTRDHLARMQSMVSDVISECLSNIEVDATPGEQPLIRLGEHDWHKIEILKTFTYYFVVGSPTLGSVQRGQAKLLSELVDMVSSWIENEPVNRIPPQLQRYVATAIEGGVPQTQAHGRAVIDYVAGLTDMQAMELHRILKGGHLEMSGTVIQ
jgi:dGTPase